MNARVKNFIYAPTESADFPGSTQDATYKPKKAEEVLSFSFAVQNDITIGTSTSASSAGKARFESVQLQFVGDLSVLPRLISKSTLGTSYNDLVIEGVANGTLFMKLELKLCFIESIQLASWRRRACLSSGMRMVRVFIACGGVKVSDGKWMDFRRDDRT